MLASKYTLILRFTEEAAIAIKKLQAESAKGLPQYINTGGIRQFGDHRRPEHKQISGWDSLEMLKLKLAAGEALLHAETLEEVIDSNPAVKLSEIVEPDKEQRQQMLVQLATSQIRKDALEEVRRLMTKAADEYDDLAHQHTAQGPEYRWKADALRSFVESHFAS